MATNKNSMCVAHKGISGERIFKNLMGRVGVSFWGANLDKTRGFSSNCHNQPQNAWHIRIVNPITIILIYDSTRAATRVRFTLSRLLKHDQSNCHATGLKDNNYRSKWWLGSAAVFGSHGALHWLLDWVTLSAPSCNMAGIFNLKRNSSPPLPRHNRWCQAGIRCLQVVWAEEPPYTLTPGSNVILTILLIVIWKFIKTAKALQLSAGIASEMKDFSLGGFIIRPRKPLFAFFCFLLIDIVMKTHIWTFFLMMRNIWIVYEYVHCTTGLR